MALDDAGVRGQLRAGGRRMTAQREAILRILDRCEGHIAADEVVRQLQAEYPDINRSTVYRTLQTLEDIGLVRHAHDQTGARAYHRMTEAAHVHLVCRRCGHEQEAAGEAVADLFAGIRERYRFEPDPTHFPIFGVCGHCSEPSN